LQAVVDEAIKYVDFSLIEGHRTNERQAELFLQKKTLARAGESPHNSDPSNAFDFLPYPFSDDWNDEVPFTAIAMLMRGIGEMMGVKIRWGGDWDRDGQLVSRDPDEHFRDLPHIERWY
jgi:peptidoglycan L-alanyl-D-glutamate endopeptidase CwlK